mmetsp:Transcript_20892/g.52795  ORF Transcript_20892/g.52795 Transcript_20892/m.52795 type:complete len:118 (+) Transcript_20892:600-953(+)
MTEFNAKWAEQVLMCFPRFLRYPNIKDDQLLVDAEQMNAHPSDAKLRDTVIRQVRGRLESSAGSSDVRTKETIKEALSSPHASSELQVKKVEIDPTGLPFPAMMSCVVMDPVKNQFL